MYCPCIWVWIAVGNVGILPKGSDSLRSYLHGEPHCLKQKSKCSFSQGKIEESDYWAKPGSIRTGQLKKPISSQQDWSTLIDSEIED